MRNRLQGIGNRLQKIKNVFSYSLKPITYNLSPVRAFTLIETLVAVSLLALSIVAPMTLAAISLSTAYYARDEVTAFHLAQEAIESVRSVRDGNILKNGYGTQTDLLAGIPTSGPFTIDTRDNTMDSSVCLIDRDGNGTPDCPPLESDTNLYGYGNGASGWTATRFVRTLRAVVVRSEADVPQEIRISATISWKTGGFQVRSFTISENLYRWVNDGSTAS